MVAASQGDIPKVVGRYLNIVCDTYSDPTNVEYTLSCTQHSKIVANGVGEPHLGAAGHREWPKTWEGPHTLYIIHIK